MTEVNVNRYPVLFRLFYTGHFTQYMAFYDGKPCSINYPSIPYDIGAWYTSECRKVFPPEGRSVVPHKAPRGDCHCGFYAYTSDYAIAAHLGRLNFRNVKIGIVEIDGDIIIHDWGVRAERMRIVRMYDNEGVGLRACRHLSVLWRRFAEDIGAWSDIDFNEVKPYYIYTTPKVIPMSRYRYPWENNK